MSHSTALLTDHYELTMVDAALADGTADRACIFELFTRRLPGARRYGVSVGVGRFLESLENFRFRQAELDWLSEQNFLQPKTLDWLANFRFTGHIWGYPEGEVFFPGSPLLIVEGSFAEGVLLETLALSILNSDSAVATAASRMVNAAGGKPLAEMGSRRTGEISAVSAARAAYIAGFSATSNLEAGRTYGIPTMGTAAHSFTLLHDSELEAFSAQVKSLGSKTTLLIDTYDVEKGVVNAVQAAGTSLGAVRIDSGDLPAVVSRVRSLLDELGATKTKITVTNDLDEYTVAALASTAVDSFGVGTSVVVGSGSPTMGMVYKLVSRKNDNGEWIPVAKKSLNKESVGGRKRAFRSLNETGVATAEVLQAVESSLIHAETCPGENSRPLLQQFVSNGIVQEGWTGKAGIERARRRHKESMLELPAIALSLKRSDPALPTEYL